MSSWIIALIVVAVLIVAICAFRKYPPLMHRHQLAHEMAGFVGRSWGPSDVLSMFWNLQIVSIVPVVSKGIEYDRVAFRVNSPSHGMNDWALSVYYNKSKEKYEGYCASDSAVQEQIVAIARAMGCDRAQEIGGQVADNIPVPVEETE